MDEHQTPIHIDPVTATLYLSRKTMDYSSVYDHDEGEAVIPLSPTILSAVLPFYCTRTISVTTPDDINITSIDDTFH